MGVHPPPSPGWADFSVMMECTPESGNCHSVFCVYSESVFGPLRCIIHYLHVFNVFFKEIFSKSILNNDSTLCKLKKVRKGTYSKMMQKFNKLNSEHKGKCIVYILQLFETYSIEQIA